MPPRRLSPFHHLRPPPSSVRFLLKTARSKRNQRGETARSKRGGRTTTRSCPRLLDRSSIASRSSMYFSASPSLWRWSLPGKHKKLIRNWDNYFTKDKHYCQMQGWAKKQSPGLVNFVPAVAYFLCINQFIFSISLYRGRKNGLYVVW